MPIAARYVHTNIVAKDWRRLAAFYQQVFGCEPVLPERSLRGPAFDAATSLHGVAIEGIHLRLPGISEGPTLEILSYSPGLQGSPAVNRQGLGHIAFSVDDVAQARIAVLSAGGSEVGQIVVSHVAGVGTLTFAYLTDPEGNVVEVQRWDRTGG